MVYRYNGRNSLVTAVRDTASLRFNMRCLKCVYNAKVAYVNLVMYCGA